MSDPLYDAIAKAIQGPIDGDLFERCAVELLRESYYPTLRPVQGGRDAGMDGVGELPSGERFFLVATVREDAQGNLDENIQSHLKAGGDRRVVVFATSRPVSGQRRAALTQHLLQESGVRLHDVHDRADFVQLLYRNPQWRRDLLGVPARARALMRLPANRRPMPQIPLIGREEEIVRLRDAEGDLVLAGKPGIGKTFLLQELMKDDWGLFDDGWSIPELEDAIREMRPRRVVLDDAHLRDVRLTVLRRLRVEMSAEFDIVAVSWPGQLDAVVEALPDSSTFELLELDRGHILEVIEAVGVSGPRELQAHLVNQSMGRAGLAATLAYTCVRGRVRDVATGDALLTDIVGWFTRSIGYESRHVLGVLALAGKSGATMRQVAQVLGLDVARVSELVRGLASGGTVDEAPRMGEAMRLRVQPESLQYSLVREVFFGGPGSLDAAETITQLDWPASALLPLVGAAHRGATVDRRLLVELLDVEDAGQVTAYALLGPSEVLEALELAPEHRASVARAAYKAGVRPELMLRILMDMAVGDARAEHSTPDHSLRVIGDHLLASERTIQERQLAVSVTNEWLGAGGDTEVAFRVLAHSLHPGIRRIASDPGLGNTITITEAILPPEIIRNLSSVWDAALDLIARERGASLAPVLDVLHYWVYPGSFGSGRGASEESGAAIRSEAVRVLRRLVEILHDRPGALRRLHSYVSRSGLDVQVDVPDDFAIVFPEHWDGLEDDDGYAGWERRVYPAVESLAVSMRELPIEDIASWIVHTDAEAEAAGIRYPRLMSRLAQLLADEVARPDLLLLKLEELGAANDVLLPFLERVVKSKQGDWRATVERLLSDQRAAWIAMQVSLTNPVGVTLKDTAIRRLTPGYRNLIASLIAREEIDGETAERLLDAPDRIVARDAAVSLWQRSRGPRLADLSVTGQAKWRDVIVNSPADDYWYSVILRTDTQLFADWLRAWFVRVSDNAVYEPLPDTIEEALRELSAAVRSDLIRAIPTEIHSLFLQDATTQLVGDDLSVALILLGRDDLAHLHGTALRDGPSEAWMERALAFLARGWEPKRIAAETAFAAKGWSGEESEHWQSKIDAFMGLRHSQPLDAAREAIIAAGIEVFSQQRDAAAVRERRERVFGFD